MPKATFVVGAGFLAVDDASTSDPPNAPTASAALPRNLSRTSSISSIRSHISRERRARDLLKISSLPVPPSLPKRSKIDWVEVFRRKNWSTFHAFTSALSTRDSDALEFSAAVRSKDSLKKYVTEMLSRVNMLEVTVPYQTRLRACFKPRVSLSPEAKRIANTCWRMLSENVRVSNEDVIARMHALRGNDRTWFVIAYITSILFDKCGKRRGLLFWGVPSSGKSFLASVISACVPDQLVGRFTMQACRSTFWFQSLLCKAFYIGEEIQLDDLTSQSLKLLLEGSRSLNTDVKFAEHVAIEYRPTIVTSNEPCYVHISKDRNAFLERALELNFIRVDSTACSRERSHQAEAWAMLATEALERFPLGTNLEVCDDALNF